MHMFTIIQYINDKTVDVNRISLQLTNLIGYVAIWAVISPAQCRAARGLIDWTQQQLADAAGVGIVTVRQFESGAAEPRRSTLEVIARALNAAGVEFIDQNGGGPGVRLRH